MGLFLNAGLAIISRSLAVGAVALDDLAAWAQPGLRLQVWQVPPLVQVPPLPRTAEQAVVDPRG